VAFEGFVPQEQLKQFYRECTVVAVSSVWAEPIATIGLEAMRHALPVVGFDAGGVQDWLKDGYNGFLVPWMDVARFAESMQRLLDDKALARQMGQNGLALARERFHFNRYISGLEEMFHLTVAERGRWPRSAPSALARTAVQSSPDENAGISRCAKQPNALL
jgi:glycosyltransferase involved in cell wall biosynthesis